MAAASKCLAQSNKSSDGAKATKKRTAWPQVGTRFDSACGIGPWRLPPAPPGRWDAWAEQLENMQVELEDKIKRRGRQVNLMDALKRSIES